LGSPRGTGWYSFGQYGVARSRRRPQPGPAIPPWAASARLVVDSLDVETIEGAGTIGLELLRLERPLDVLLLPLGNGALCNGVATVMKKRSPTTRVVAVAAAGASAVVDSWRSGRLVEHERTNTIADGLASRSPIPEALADMDGLIDDAFLVEDASMIIGMRLLHSHTGLVAEPSGAAGVAAILENPGRFRGLSSGRSSAEATSRRTRCSAGWEWAEPRPAETLGGSRRRSDPSQWPLLRHRAPGVG
jgi:hypothetical protein